MDLVALPASTDNYIWMLHDGQPALIVDPGEAGPVFDALDRLALQLDSILVTHHHADHVGGIGELRPRLQGRDHGPAAKAIPEPYEPLAEGHRVQLPGPDFLALEVPGQTAGRIAYLQVASTGAALDAPILCCGDTSFSGGCGRLFEGTPAPMFHWLGRLAVLPSGTRVCCNHEYTLSNLRFALAVEPANLDLQAYAASCRQPRDAGQPTLPSTIGLERRINPFLRTSTPAVIAAAPAQGATSDDEIEVSTTLRRWKDGFQ